ncbi:acyltransferase family protein [Hymenobacter negativus]|uniref:Acyltransferase n=1 Tax=Hymenobacter negativus TaxID=2795026 RepID=A0ABS3QCF7_9BACT|nr:acyltransferase [Hymenobacter negativus]MBO2008872.1 acyltransferase [Hymenobacter negativus]
MNALPAHGHRFVAPAVPASAHREDAIQQVDAHQAPPRQHAIDLLRLVAALAVVLYHVAYRGYHAEHASPVDYPALGRVFKYGYLGVEVFFVISGYVVLLSAQGKTVRQFFVSRVARLYPAYWVACTLTFGVVRLWAPPVEPGVWSALKYATVSDYAYNLTMLQSFFGRPNLDGVYWTLGCEISFYLLIALLIGFGWMQRHLVPFLWGWLGYCALVGPSEVPQPLVQLLIPRYAPFFMAGMVFFLIQTRQAASWKGYLLLLATYAESLRAGRAISADMEPFFHEAFSLPVTWTVLTGGFVFFLLLSHGWLRLRPARWLAWAGALSYPIYLLHHNLGFVVLQRLGSQVNKYVLLAGLLGALLVAAYGLHVLVERRYSSKLRQQLLAWLE